MIKAVIFDLDGVVIDSPKIYFKVMKEFLKTQHLNISDQEISKLITLSLKDELSQINARYSLDISFKVFLNKTLEKSLRIAQKECKVNEGVKELLLDLRKNSFLLALASNNDKKAVDFALKKFELKNFFSSIISGEDVTKGKPDPEIYLKSAEKLKVHPRECIAIEDTLIGLESAKSAGMKCIAIQNSFASKDDFLQADLLLKNFSDLTAKKLSLM